MQHRLVDFLSDLNCASCAEQVFQTLIRHLNRVGFSKVNYVYAERDEDGQPKSVNHTNLCPKWIDYYTGEDLVRHDYAVHWILNRKTEILRYFYTDIPELIVPTEDAKSLWSHANEQGFGAYIGIPLTDICGLGAGGLSMGSDLMTQRDFDRVWETEGGFLVSAVHIAHSRMKSEYMNAKHLGLKLSRRQKQIVEGLARGESNKTMAHRLGMTEATVSFHLRSTADRLGVRTSREILPRALAHNLIHP